MTTCYNLIDIRVKSVQVQARPIAWDREISDGFGNDKHGNPVCPTEFHATCPHCGNLIHFTKDDIYKDELERDNVKCLICGAGAKSVQRSFEKAPETVEVLPHKEVFIDPISSGLFDLEVDHELLERLESTKTD